MHFSSVRVLLVDDREVSRRGLKSILTETGRFEIVGEAVESDEVVSATIDLNPDVVLIDALSNGMCPVSTTHEVIGTIESKAPRVMVLVNAMNDVAMDTLAAGATGVVLNGSRPEELRAAVNLVASGYLVLTPEHARDHLSRARPARRMNGAVQSRIDSLTERETEVLRLVAKGYTNAGIATELCLSDSTVKSHVQHVLNKLSMRSRVHAAIFCYETGLIRLGDSERWFKNLELR